MKMFLGSRENNKRIPTTLITSALAYWKVGSTGYFTYTSSFDEAVVQGLSEYLSSKFDIRGTCLKEDGSVVVQVLNKNDATTNALARFLSDVAAPDKDDCYIYVYSIYRDSVSVAQSFGLGPTSYISTLSVPNADTCVQVSLKAFLSKRQIHLDALFTKAH